MMTPTTLQALFAPAVWLLAALLCLLLEAAGTPTGWRKRGARNHLPWIIALAGVVVVAHAFVAWPAAASPATSATGLVVDRAGLFVGALLSALVALTHAAAVPGLRAIDEERGEMSAAFATLAAALMLLCVAADLVVLVGAVTLSTASLALLAAPDRDGPHGVEAATKGVIGAGLVLVLLSLAIVFVWTATGDTSFQAIGRALHTQPALGGVAVALIVSALAVMLGAVPLHQMLVDVTHGASAASSGLLAAGATLAGGAVTLRIADSLAGDDIALGFSALAVLTLVGAPIASLDQARIGRVAAYLAILPGGLILAAAAALVVEPGALAWRAGTWASVAGGVGAAAALLGVVVPRLDPSSTWEDWAGFGRRRPVVAALLVYALGTVAGVPGTPGFDARLDVARAAFTAHLDVLGLIVVGSAAVGAAPLVRLALFLFAKEPPQRSARPLEASLLVVVFSSLACLAAAMAVWPGFVDAILRAAR